MKRTILFLLIALLPAISRAEDQVITDLMLIGANTSSEINSLAAQYTSQGWQSFGYDLNKGCGQNSDYIFLLYKTGSISNKDKAYSFISDVCIYVGQNYPDELVYNDIDYELVPYDGSDRFKSLKGDLNCNAGGAYIHLYCSRQVKATPYYVSSIWFNATSSGSVPGANQSGSIDLNQGAGGNYIYMHCNKVPFDNPIYNEADAERHIFLPSVYSNVFFSKGNYHLKNRMSRGALKLTFAPGCTVTLDNVSIPFRPTEYANYAGITFRGDATINLMGTNEVSTLNLRKPAIYVPQGHTLTIKGDGSLKADSHSDVAAGIGGSYEEDCGNIVIEGGDIYAHSGINACGIGNGANATCGTIKLSWTRETDRIYSSSYPAGKVGFVNGKNFLIEGTDMEAHINNFNFNGQSIVPLVESNFCRPWGTREGNYCGKENINGGRNLYYIKLPCSERSDMHTVTIKKNPTVLDGNGDMNDYYQRYSPWISIEKYYDSNGYEYVSIIQDILHVVVDEGVTSIGRRAFFDIWSIQDVTLPSSLTSIGYEAFIGCIDTKDVYCHADPERLTWDETRVLDFNHDELKSTKMHVFARYLSKYEEKFGDANVTFVGDLDDIIDSIGNVKADMATDDAWYTLDGMKLNGKPAKPGVYITGGRKVAIK